MHIDLKLLFTLLLAVTSYYARPNTYYFSESEGDDARSTAQAQQVQTPWRSLNKLNAFMSDLRPGDSVLFKRGDIFNGVIIAGASGAAGRFITYGAYGQGNKPVISGLASIRSWTPLGDGTWEAALSSQPVNILLMNRKVKARGRYPNATDPNNGFLTIESSAGQGQLTDEQLPSSPDWTGGTIIIRKNRWVLDKDSIIRHAGKTIHFESSTNYSPSAGYGYFIQDHPRTLDVMGEWYFNATAGKLYACFEGTDPRTINVDVATGEQLVVINNRSFLSFEDLNFEGANTNAFQLSNASNIRVINCNVRYSGINAFEAQNSNDLRVQGCTINYTNNIAFNGNNCSGVVLSNNIIFCTGIFAGMGQSNSGSYEGIILNGNNNLIEYNSIDSTGYIPVTFGGNDVVIRNNFIRSFAFVKDDGGGIYTWNNAAGATANINRNITGNIILDGKGAGAGTDDIASARVHGIYIDDNAGNVNITGNSVANCGEYGLFIHNAHDLVIMNNTVYNNRAQIVLSRDNAAPGSPVRNIQSTNNILFSKLITQPVAEFSSVSNDVGNFGSFDSNYYCRPFDDDLVIRVYNDLLDLEAWQQLYHKDLHSNKSPLRLARYLVNGLTGGNRYANGSFDSDIGGLYIYSTAGNATAAWTNAAGLDNGALSVQFTGQAPADEKAYVIIAIGAVTAGRNYIVRYSLKDANEYKNMQVFLRKSLSPYTDLSGRAFRRITANRTENEFLFTAAESENNTSLVFELPAQSSPVYLDNVQLYESTVSITNPDDSIRFLYNASRTAATTGLDGTYIDARKNIYTGSITLTPYTAAVLIRVRNLQALPGQFLSFQGWQANDLIRLRWTVARDTANGFYEVERSGTGMDFSKIGQVGVNGREYDDLGPLEGANYYRLRYGTGVRRLYSPVIRINYRKAKKTLADLENEDMILYPNPVTNRLQVSIVALPITQPVSFTIYTAKGVLIRSIPVSLRNNQVTIDMSFLSAGMYSLRFLCRGKVLVRTFIKAG